ncbi:ATP-binding cassette domain-containing protein [Fusibacter paucivorans]|uniref:ATP-binding cassette domain-containing protein n=1 Tax=Fusibacter paucivorans TaxID=76009 RepID=A0ABS5PK89_9FIRM|nr:ATP-binding cassette domain-containing protein [Fusibacter paucivorans]MBS7525585.1 ATP-binding cassette domain-containing protein [Fusibacter paucivorans]
MREEIDHQLPLIKIENLTKRYQDTTILSALSFYLAPEEVLVIMGPSGIGKSTLLSILANLESYDGGHIQYDSRLFDRIAVPLPVVFQGTETLMPWMTVMQHLLLVAPNLEEAETRQILERVALWEHRLKKPSELSGGMKQRLAFARALACQSKVILMDEPFTGLDEALKESLYQLLKEVQRERGLSIILVTHDTREAEKLGNRILELKSAEMLIEKIPGSSD